MLKFTDGEKFDTSGRPRIEKRYDGLYVLGNGFMVPVNDFKDGLKSLGIISNCGSQSLSISILQRAFNSNFITEEDLLVRNNYAIAEEIAEYHSDDEEIGSSDMTFIVKEFLDGMGKKTDFVKGFLTIID